MDESWVPTLNLKGTHFALEGSCWRGKIDGFVGFQVYCPFAEPKPDSGGMARAGDCQQVQRLLGFEGWQWKLTMPQSAELVFKATERQPKSYLKRDPILFGRVSCFVCFPVPNASLQQIA